MTFRRRIEVLVFTGVFGLGAYFYNGYGWNQTARYDAIWAFVEPGAHQYTFAIDDFVTDTINRLNTGDWARNLDHSPHYYSNKAPGASLLGIPAYLALYHGERAAGIDPESVRSVHVNAYLLNLWVTVLPVAVSAVFFYGLALRFTRRGRALLLTSILYGCTLLLPFSTMLWAHATAAAFVVMALAHLVRPGARAAVLVGLFAGLAVLTDYGAAPLAATVTVAALFHDDRRVKAPGVILGGAGPLALFMAYHWWVFGSPFALASSYSPAEMVEAERVFGLFGGVNPTAVWGLTFSTTRGLFFYMPVLLLAFVGLGRLRPSRAEETERRPPLAERYDPTAANADLIFWWVAVVNVVAVFLVNTTFNGWHGGFSTGPRYQIVALPCWVLLLALLPDRPWATRALYALAAVSFLNMFVAAAVSPAAPDAFRGSALLFCYAKVADVLLIDLGWLPRPNGNPPSLGSLHLYPGYPMRDWAIAATDPTFTRWASFNLGERLLALRGTLSLLPALVGGGVVAWWSSRIVRTQNRRERLR